MKLRLKDPVRWQRTKEAIGIAIVITTIFFWSMYFFVHFEQFVTTK